MPFEVKYDDGITQWSAFFESEEEALAQAGHDVTAYGGTAPQEIVDGTGAQVADQDAIIEASTP